MATKKPMAKKMPMKPGMKHDPKKHAAMVKSGKKGC